MNIILEITGVLLPLDIKKMYAALRLAARDCSIDLDSKLEPTDAQVSADIEKEYGPLSPKNYDLIENVKRNFKILNVDYPEENIPMLVSNFYKKLFYINSVYDDAERFMKYCMNRKYSMFILSNESDEFVKQFVHYFNYNKMVSGFTGSSSFEETKPSEKAFNLLLEAKLKPQETFFISTKFAEIEIARKLGYRCILLKRGWFNPSEYKAAIAEFECRDLDEAFNYIKSKEPKAILK